MMQGQLHRVGLARLSLMLVRLLVGGVFVWSSVSKLRFPYEFLKDVYGYEMLGAKAGMILAMVLPWLELAVGMLLLAGSVLGGALLTSMLLLMMFVIGQSSAIYRGLEISCGCFSANADGAAVTYATVLRTGALLAATAIGYVLTVTVKASRAVDAPAMTTG